MASVWPEQLEPTSDAGLNVPHMGQSLLFENDGQFPRLGHFITNFCFSGAPFLHYQPLVLPQAGTQRPPRLELPSMPRVYKGGHHFCCIAVFSPHIQGCSHNFLFQSSPHPSLPWHKSLPPVWNFTGSPIWPMAWVSLSGHAINKPEF